MYLSTCSNWSNNLWKFRFAVSELDVEAGEQDNINYSGIVNQYSKRAIRDRMFICCASSAWVQIRRQALLWFRHSAYRGVVHQLGVEEWE